MANDMGLTEKCYIMAGITPFKSVGMANYMKKFVPGLSVPDEYITRLKGVPKDKQAAEGIKIAQEQIQQCLEMRGIAGIQMGTKVYKPQDIYTGPRVKDAPDLIVYFGDLYWRAGQDIGHGSIYSFETEIGPDDAVHDDLGVFAFRGGEARGGANIGRIQIVDVASTILDSMGCAVPSGMEGKVAPLNGTT